jgi:hypothetical protein
MCPSWSSWIGARSPDSAWGTTVRVMFAVGWRSTPRVCSWPRGMAPVACCYSQYVDFSPAAVSLLSTDAAFTDSALTRKTHRPDGNSIHVVTVSSIAPGGRRALFEALLCQMTAQSRAFLILFSRLSGLRDYCRMLAEKGGTPARPSPRFCPIGSRIPPVAIAARWSLFPSRAIAIVNRR